MTAVFESILNISFSAVWLIVAVVCARALLFRAPKWTRMLLWALVAVRLVLPFTVESPLSLVPESKPIELTIVETPEGEPKYIQVQPTEQSPAPIAPVTPVTPNVPQGDITPAPITPDIPSVDEKPTEQSPVVDLSPETVTATPVEEEGSPVNIGLILSLVWIAGMALMVCYFALSYLSLRIRLRDAVHGEGRVWHSDRIDTAFVFGLMKTRIYLPFGMNAEDSAHVLAHEKAHIRRGDHIIKPLAFFILTLHWFNPAVWLAYILFCKDVELACDEAVIRGMDAGKVSEYSHALVTLSTRGNRKSLHPISFGGANMKKRLKSILSYKKPTLWIIIAALLVCVTVAVCFFTSPARNEESGGTTEPTSTESTEPDDEDKEYIFRREDAEPVTISYRIQNMGDMAFPFDCLNDVTVDVPTSQDDQMFQTYIKDAYIGEKVEGDIPEREVITTVTVTYSDGSSVTCDMEYTEKDGEAYKVEHLSYIYGIENYTKKAISEIQDSFPGQSADAHYIFEGYDYTDQFLSDNDTVYTLYHANGKSYTLTQADFDIAPQFYMTVFLQTAQPENGKVTVRAPEGEEDVTFDVDLNDIVVEASKGDNMIVFYGGDAGLCEFRTPDGSYWFTSFHNVLSDDFGYGMNATEFFYSDLELALGDPRTIKFEAETDEAAEVFFTRTLPEHYLGYSFDYRRELYSEYELLGYEVVKEEEGKLYVKGTYAFKIKGEEKYNSVVGGKMGEGEWAGWRYAEDYNFVLAKDSKGLWRIESSSFPPPTSTTIEQSDKYLSEGYTKHSDGVYLKNIAGMDENLLFTNYVGYVVLCTDPNRVSMVSDSDMLNDGMLIEDIMKDTGAIVGFNDIPADAEFPAGIIADGKIVKNASEDSTVFTGITEDGKLFIEKCTAEEAIAEGVKNGCSAHVEILNDGEPVYTSPFKTATPVIMAQRESGEMIFIIIDGRQSGYSAGCRDLNEILRILSREKCTDAALLYSAASTLAAKGENGVREINRCNAQAIPSINAWIIK